MNILFSLVLYRHSFQDIAPLLSSIDLLGRAVDHLHVRLSIYNACPHSLDDPTPDRVRSIIGDILLSYRCGKNIGFGAANNHNFNSFKSPQDFLFVVVNPDISFDPASLMPLLDWAVTTPLLACVAPLILSPSGSIQFSAKRNPTFLSLLLGRLGFLRRLPFFQRYDRWHRNLYRDYERECIDATYLSGCFLVIPSLCFSDIGGFCERYFLHLEDADIVRRLSRFGRCIHNPIGSVTHQWARGSHRSPTQMLHLMHSYFVYLTIWGFRLY